MNTEKLSALTTRSASIEDSLFLTFDFDWAAEEVLQYVYDFLKKHALKATFFVTHHSSISEKYYSDPDFEFCIHPNFNYLLEGDFRYGSSMSEVLDYYESILPFKPIGMRSHDSFFKTALIRELNTRGYLYESNLLLNGDLNLIPFKNWGDNVLQIPMLWEDDQWCISSKEISPQVILKYKYLKVVNFHPIHIYLNSVNLIKYQSIKSHQNDISKMRLARNADEYGVYNFLKDLVGEM